MTKQKIAISKTIESADRRRFVGGLGGLAVVTVAGITTTRAGVAAALPHLEENDPTGQALGYREDAARVDATKFPQRQASQHCSNCNFFQAPDGGYGPCQLFAGKTVNANGWCSAYAPKTN